MLTWILVSFGITIAVTTAAIFMPIRERAAILHPLLGKVVNCPMCFSFWSGLFLSFFWKSITDNFFLDGCLSIGGCWLLYCICLNKTQDEKA